MALWLSIYSVLSVVVHAIGVLNAAHAVMKVKSPRAAVAWGISLSTFPWVAIPLYWILGKNKFQGYTEAVQQAYREHRDLVSHAYNQILEFKTPLPAGFEELAAVATRFTALPFTLGNTLELLVNGRQTFPRMLEAIATANHYILLQTYILHADDIGNQFKDALIARAQKGVRVYLLYDGIGSYSLSRRYLHELREHGVQVGCFRSSRGFNNPFQINFRNHRKILVVDGEIAFVGGLNIGDEYLGKDPKLGDWRDTHISVQGPTVECLQTAFLQDWYWAQREVLKVSWQTNKGPYQATSDRQTAFVLSTGPADPQPVCSLFFLNLINRAQKRLWIASPYFVPDSSTLNALKLAAIRGVDVRILLPAMPDQKLVYWCSFSYYDELKEVGIQVYRYQPGFMHQKVILCDQEIAGIGTVNLDNRSFFLNFEVMTFIIDPNAATEPTSFINEVEAMLEADWQDSRLVDLSKYAQKPLWFKFLARVSRLLAPIL